jgi:hypothetical protein
LSLAHCLLVFYTFVMWTPWSAVVGWGHRSQESAVENARAAAVECSRALVERIEVDLYLAELTTRQKGPDSLTG